VFQYGLEWHALDTYFQFVEVSAPGTPEANNIRLYAKDNGSGVSQLCYKNDAGTEVCLPVVGPIVTGSGVANQVAIWSGTSTLIGDTGLTFDPTTNILSISSLSDGAVVFTTTAGALGAGTSFLYSDTTKNLTLNAGGINNSITFLSGNAANRTTINIGRAATEGSLAVGGVGEFSDIAAAGDITLRAGGTNNNLILAARSTTGLLKFTTANPDTLKAAITSGGDFLVGNVIANPFSTVVGRGAAVVRANVPGDLSVQTYRNDATAPVSTLRGVVARGTAAVPLTLASGDRMSIAFTGHDGTNFASQAFIEQGAAEAWTLTAKGTHIQFYTTPLLGTGALERVRIAPGGDLLVGAVANPFSSLVGRGAVVVRNTALSSTAEMFVGQFGSAGTTVQYRMCAARGTDTAPTATQSADAAGLCFMGYGATTFSGARAFIRMVAAENWTDAAQGAYLTLETTPLLGATLTERFRVGPAGQWGIGGATFGTTLDVYTSGGAAAPPTWTSPGALTKVDDTNVTLTLGGTPATALLRAASLTLGWAGQLSIARGGTSASTALGAFNALSPLTTRGDLLTRDASNNVRLAVGGANTLLKSNGTDPSWLDYTTDWLSQYALLAGRSGGQTLKGGTAASEDLTLQATSHATLGTVIIPDFPLGLSERTLRLGSANGWLGGIIPAALNVGGTIGNTGTSHCAILIDTRFNGSAENPIGCAMAPYFAPSASIGTARGGQAHPQFDPASGVTITEAQGHAYRLDYVGSDGAVTTGITLLVEAPTFGGTLKPTTQHGLEVRNQGAASITDAVGIRIDAQSGATNNYVFELPTDNTDPTGGGGAATGRIKCLIGGATRYIPYY